MTKNTHTLRTRYANALSGLTYDNANKALIARKIGSLTWTCRPSPGDFIRAIESLRIPCRRCAGTGSFITGTNNGKPTGPGGACFRCAGRGSQTHTDGHRNCTHDENYMARMLHY